MISAVACNKTDGDDTTADTSTPNEPALNIIDDNYRNWYEIFVYSYYDSDNDGIGDLNGVTAKLDYIKEMGFNGIWLMPVHPSPTYHKYDVNDYYAIDPQYGTLDDMKKLIEEAHKRDIKIILDLVLNHSSINNKWFTEACDHIKTNGQPGGEYGEYYNFSTEKLGGYSQLSGTAYYYESRFWSGMPDLNLNGEKVKAEIVDIMKYWMNDYGVDGFRLDAVTSYYTGETDKNVQFLSWLNTEAKKIKPDCYMVGEAWEGNDYQISRYYESGIDSFFLFTGAQATGTIATAVKQQSGKSLGKLMEDLQTAYPKGIPAPFLGNHDTMRPGSFMPGEDALKMAAGVLAMMNGGTYVYYGEEIGMISKNGSNSDPAKRIAMKWSDKSVYEGWCYVSPEGTPVDETSYYYPSVEAQQADGDSILNYYKKAMRMRNSFPSIARGKVENIPCEKSAVCVVTKTYKDEKITIVMNLSEFEEKITLDKNSLGYSALAAQLCTSGEVSVTDNGDGSVTLPPYSIAIFK